MKFYEVVDQVLALLQRKGRISYRALKREFDLDDEYLEDLKAEIIDAQKLAVDEDSKVLVWIGEGENGETAKRGNGEKEKGVPRTPDSGPRTPHFPGRWTPAHLAERIRAEQAAMESRGSVDGERKTITALFADLKGSTALIEGLDPEDARAIIDPALQLMMDAVHRYEGYVAQALGEAQLKGVEDPLNVYEVLGAGPLRTRLQVAARRGLTRFVGRHSELEQMKQALDQARAGHGQIVGVMGEPGLGKSRLFYEFKLTSRSGDLVLEAYSVSHGKASPYLPVIELLKSYCQIQPQDDERTRREKVGGKVLMLDRSLEETLPYLFSLLSIDDSTSSLQQMDPQIRRRRTFDAIKKLFLRESLNQPLILIFEDLHWIDSETQGFLDALSESVASARILLLVNYRPEYRHEWGTKTYYTQLRLVPLGKEEAEELLTFLLGNDVGLKSLKQLILEKTEGTPFFMEEVVQELFEQGVLVRDAGGARLRPGSSSIGHVPLPTDLHIPTTVQGVLAARIDRLALEEKALLQQLAVIGREFPLSLVKQVVAQPEDELYRWLSALQKKEFLYEQPAFPEVEYLFKHALTQEVAYGTVLQERRKALHGRTAQAIEEVYRYRLEDHYSELAHHYSRSGNTQKAVDYLHLAGHSRPCSARRMQKPSISSPAPLSC